MQGEKWYHVESKVIGDGFAGGGGGVVGGWRRTRVKGDGESSQKQKGETIADKMDVRDGSLPRGGRWHIRDIRNSHQERYNWSRDHLSYQQWAITAVLIVRLRTIQK